MVNLIDITGRLKNRISYYQSREEFKGNKNATTIAAAFDWDKTPEGFGYWSHISKGGILSHSDYIEKYNSINKDEYILKHFKRGNIVVSLENIGLVRKRGDIFKVLNNSDPTTLIYGVNNASRDYSSWRLACTEEIKAYNNGIRHIKNIKGQETNFDWPSITPINKVKTIDAIERPSTYVNTYMQSNDKDIVDHIIAVKTNLNPIRLQRPILIK